MSKFRVIDGNNTQQFVKRNKDIEDLKNEIKLRRVLSDKDLFIFSYHFARLEHPLLAQKYLNKIKVSYFKSEIFKDLYQALLAWSILKANPTLITEKVQKTYEFFLVVNRGMELFAKLSFKEKAAFMKLKEQLKKYNNFTN